MYGTASWPPALYQIPSYTAARCPLHTAFSCDGYRFAALYLRQCSTLLAYCHWQYRGCVPVQATLGCKRITLPASTDPVKQTTYIILEGGTRGLIAKMQQSVWEFCMLTNPFSDTTVCIWACAEKYCKGCPAKSSWPRLFQTSYTQTQGRFL